MIALPNSPTGRIVLAIALSLVIHMALLFTPVIELAPTDPPLPPLMAKLEALPTVIAKPPQPKQPHKAPTPAKPKPVMPTPQVTPAPAEPVVDEPVAEVASEVAPVPAIAEPEKIADPVPTHPLPKHADLTFSVMQGTDFKVGEARQRFDISPDHHYTLKVGVNTTGIVSLLKKFDLNQTSSGTVDSHGLQPNEFRESKNNSGNTETHTANFDWQAKALNFSTGSSIALPEYSQDIISFVYQLSQVPWSGNPLSMYISNGRKLEHYEISVGEEELITTRMGKLRAIPFRKVHGPNEEGLNIWLAVEYRLLPVKISQTNGDGSVAAEMVISAIRVSDD